MRKILLALALLLVPAIAQAQCTGVFPAKTLCGNLGATAAPPSAFAAGGAVSGPVSSTVGHFATWGNTTGTLLADYDLFGHTNTFADTQTFTKAPVFTDQSGSRTALGLGTAATQATGTSGATLPFANGINTWADTQTFTKAPVFTDQSGSRTALGLGTSATVNTGTSGATIPLLNGVNTYSGASTFTAAVTGTTITTSVAYLNTSSVPSLSSCGTSPSVATGSNNAGGQFTTGSSTGTNCTITFANAYPNNAFCTTSLASSSAATGATPYMSSLSASGFTLTTTVSSKTYNYTCTGN